MEELSIVKWFVENISITNVLLFIIAITLIAFLTKFPEYVGEKFKKRNSRVLQVEQFYRQINGNDLKSLLDEWVEYFHDAIDDVNDFDPDKIKDLVKRTSNITSEKTNQILSSMLQHTFAGNDDPDDHFIIMIYMSSIVSSIKNDFTGEYISPFLLIQSRISDFEISKNKFRKANNIYKKELRKTKAGIGMSLTASLLIIVIILIIIVGIGLYFINKM